MDLLLHGQVAEGAAAGGARRWQRVVVARRRVLDSLERHLCREAADDDGEVVRRARGRAESRNLLRHERRQLFLVEERLGLLEEEGLVRRAAALGHELELVLRAGRREQLDLRRQVCLRVRLREHVQRRHLRVAQVGARIRVEDALRQVRLVIAVGPYVLAALAHHDRRPRVLAARQDFARRDVGVLEQLECNKLVVAGRLRVVEDVGELLEVARPEQVGDVNHRLRGQQPQRLRLD
mmetsp:Transcript_66390/g.198308  ORF Transcript_66390/g.198308 Transcript_66390/m.198308 type:complete len:237 (-) Transcript_66390:192-902(-)